MNSFLLGAAGALIASSIFGALFRFFLPGYLAEKGKNLATKEDVAAITREVKRVEDEYARGIEALKQQYAVVLQQLHTASELRLAAADARLKAHQEAFALWRRMIGEGHSGDRVPQLVLDCQEWWEHNCLYLSPEASTAFVKAYAAAHSQPEIEKTRDPKLTEQNWALVKVAGDAIRNGANLPPLGIEEVNPFYK